MALNVVQLMAPYNSGQAIPGLATAVINGAGLTIDSSGIIALSPATTTTIGGVIADGTTIAVDSSGVISVVDPPVTSFVYFDDLSSAFDGVQDTFTLTVGGTATSPSPTSNIQVFLGGVAQTYGTSYTVSGNQITFTEPPEFQTNFVSNTVSSAQPQGFVYFDDISTAFDGITTSFQLTVGGVVTSVSSPTISVFLGGVLQAPGGAYSVSGSTITFTEAPPFQTAFIATAIA